MSKKFAVAFTGTSDKLKPEQEEVILETIEGLTPPASFWSGAAQGVDCYAAMVAMEEFPDAEHFVCIPYWRNENGVALPCPYDVTGVQELTRKGAITIHCTPAQTKAEGYMLRNGYLARHCTHMLAFPAQRKEVKRSGTWATVRRARKLNRKVKVVPLGT